MDMARYLPRWQTETRQEHHVYNLFAVSVILVDILVFNAWQNHYGGLNGGHYTACAFNGYQQKWYNFDDTRVGEIEEDQVKSKAAYILFYARQTPADARTVFDWWSSRQ
jgi:ubiquitin C-terminal hydrolase